MYIIFEQNETHTHKIEMSKTYLRESWGGHANCRRARISCCIVRTREAYLLYNDIINTQNVTFRVSVINYIGDRVKREKRKSEMRWWCDIAAFVIRGMLCNVHEPAPTDVPVRSVINQTTIITKGIHTYFPHSRFNLDQLFTIIVPSSDWKLWTHESKRGSCCFVTVNSPHSVFFYLVCYIE